MKKSYRKSSLAVRLVPGIVVLYSLLPSCVSAQTIATSNVGANQVTLGLTSTTTGTGSFTILTSSASCGTATQTANGQDSTGAAAFRQGSLSLTANQAGSYTVRNLLQTTRYTVCFTPDGGTAPATLAFTTNAAPSLAGKDWLAVGGAGFSAGIIDNPLLAFAPDGTPYVAYVANDTRMPVVVRYTGGSWSVLAGGTAFAATGVHDVSFAFAPDGTPYLAYQDTGNNSKETVMRYSGGAWSVVGTAGFSAGVATQNSLAFGPDGSPYVAYVDEGPGSDLGAATVMHFSAGSWSAVGGAQFTPFLAVYPSLAIAPDGTPYLAFGDASVNATAASVMRYSGGAWTYVGAAGFTKSTAELLSFTFAPDGTPSLAYEDDGNTRMESVMQYRAGSWSNVGPAGFSPGRVDQTSLAFASDNTPFVAYLDAESGNYDSGRVMQYTGGTWNTVGSVISAANSASYFSLAFGPDGTPYVAYMDLTNGGKATVVHLGTAAIAPSLSITPAAITFASTIVGAVSATQTATLSNSGTSAVYLTSPTLTDTTDFTQSDNCGGIVVAGSSCTVSFTFTPKSTGALSSIYSVADLNNQSSPVTVALSGNGVAVPSASFSPTALNFTTVANTQGSNQSTTLTNSGSGTLNISSLAITGSNAASFSIVSTTCGALLAPNASCSITVALNTTSVGSYGAVLTATDNASPTTQTVALSGTISGVPHASISPGSLAFTTTAGTGSSAQTVTLTNTGTATLSIASVALTGTNATAFTLNSNCGASLAVGANCTVNILFASATAGTYTATLLFTDNSGSSGTSGSASQSVSLSGTAIAAIAPDFTITATPAAQTSYHGHTVTYAVQLASLLPANPFSSSIMLSASGLPSGATATFSPATVIPGAQGASTTMTVSIPALVGANDPAPNQHERHGGGALFALALFGLGWRTRRRRAVRLSTTVAVAALFGSIITLSGCGNGNGFATPLTTSTITITAIGGSITHTTTVNITVK